jgi:hypothetical protein
LPYRELTRELCASIRTHAHVFSVKLKEEDAAFIAQRIREAIKG